MPQARGNETRAVDSLSARNDKVLAENQTIVQREDGAVLLTTTLPNGSATRRRLDSEGDLDHQQKGGSVWWKTLLEQQKARNEVIMPAPKKKSTKKVTSDE